MSKTDEILEKLKNTQQPQIDNPEEMTDLIMGSLTPNLFTERERRSINYLPVVRAVLSFAAMWILGFFIYLQYDAAAPKEMAGFPQGSTEGACTLREVYKYRLCQDCKKTISYTQIKSKLYENK